MDPLTPSSVSGPLCSTGAPSRRLSITEHQERQKKVIKLRTTQRLLGSTSLSHQTKVSLFMKQLLLQWPTLCHQAVPLLVVPGRTVVEEDETDNVTSMSCLPRPPWAPVSASVGKGSLKGWSGLRGGVWVFESRMQLCFQDQTGHQSHLPVCPGCGPASLFYTAGQSS